MRFLICRHKQSKNCILVFCSDLLPMKFVYYSSRYLEVQSQVLGGLWWFLVVAIVVWSVIDSLMHGGYTVRETPTFDFNFWKDYAVDGNW